MEIALFETRWINLSLATLITGTKSLMHNTIESLRKTLNQSIACPIDWTSRISNREMRWLLHDYWLAIVMHHQVDRESQYVLSGENIDGGEQITLALEAEDESSINAAILNVRSWVGIAGTEYVSRTQGVASLKCLGRDRYPKHFAPSGKSKSEIIDLSRWGDSILFPEFDVDRQLRMAWELLTEIIPPEIEVNVRGNSTGFRSDFQRVFSAHQIFRGCAPLQIGASKGKATDKFALDVDFNIGEAHIYPEDEH